VTEELPSEYLDRFGGIARLYGAKALPRLLNAHIAIIGIGGIGSWTAEALARSGVGSITLIDLDEVCVTNVNRQLPAHNGNIGRFKVHAVAERLRLINPSIKVYEEVAFFTEKNSSQLLANNYDCVVDAIDDSLQKALLIATCRDKEIPLVVVGGAGGKQNPACVSTDDLAFATHDNLLRLVRRDLRSHYQFPHEEAKAPFGFRCVFSTENAKFPWSDGSVRSDPEPRSDLKLDCESGFGTSTPVTGTFGFAAASEAIAEVLTNLDQDSA
tara:strand:- start:433 stop:1242 length:810 start_codon:yes stop_codon:yes gene_type:complete